MVEKHVKRIICVCIIAICITIKITFYGLYESIYTWRSFLELSIYNVVPLLLIGWIISDKKFKWIYLIFGLLFIDIVIFANLLKISLINEPVKITDIRELSNVITVRHSIYNAETKKLLWIFADTLLVLLLIGIKQRFSSNGIVKNKHNSFDINYIKWSISVIISAFYLYNCYSLVPKQLPPFKPGYEPWTSEINRYRSAGIIRYSFANTIQYISLIVNEYKYTPKKTDVISSITRINTSNVNVAVESKNFNVIFILVEAMSKLVFDSPDLIANNVEVAPFVKSLKNEELFTTNLFSARLGGATSECEFVLLASLMPPSHKYGYAYSRYMTHAYNGLPRELKKYGYNSAVFHAGERDFWHRVNAYKAFGFERYDSAQDYNSGTVVGLGLSDKDFLNQTAVKLKTLPTPFFSMLITLSSHYPFDGLPNNYSSDISQKLYKYPKIVRNYLESIHYVDACLKTFWEDIADLRKNSIVVIVGDHNPAFYDKSAFKSLGYKAESNNDPEFTEGKQVPLVISVPESINITPHIYNIIADQADVAPTLMFLLGKKIPNNFVGENMFSKNVTGTQFTDGIIHEVNKKYNSESRKCFVGNKLVSIEECKNIESKYLAEEIITNDVIFGKRYSYENK